MATKKKEDNLDYERVIEEKSEKSDVLLTVRQFFYINKQFNEKLISTLERTHKDTCKISEDWVKMCIRKKIIFK